MTEGMPPARPRIELTDGLVRLRAHTSADIDQCSVKKQLH